MHLNPAALIRAYPRSWRERYGDEMRAVLERRPGNLHDAIDLLRGAADAWLHPAQPSLVPALAALGGGGLWTMVAVAVAVQPAPPDWPGYLMELIPVALVAATFLLAATLGCALRSDGRGGRAMAVAVGLTVTGSVAWMAALAAATAGLADGPTLAAAQAAAMIGTALVGMLLVQAGDEAVGLLLVVGPVAMLIPWTTAWLVLGAAWTMAGTILLLERSGRPEARSGTW